MRRLLHAASVLALMLASWPAFALNCSVSIGDLTFGQIPTLSASPVDSATPIQVRCDAPLDEMIHGNEVTLCISLGSGSALPYSVSPAGARKLTNGTEFLIYDLYADSSRSRVWGSDFDGGIGQPSISMKVALSPLAGMTGGSGVARSTIYGRVFGHQQDLSVGQYGSSFTSGEVRVLYDYSSRMQDCTLAKGSGSSAESSFRVSALVQGQCSISVSPMNFGVASGALIEATATSSLSVQCADQTPYRIGLGPGEAPGISPLERNLVARDLPGRQKLRYSLYQDAAHTHEWGDQPEVNDLQGVANGQVQLLRVYGRVPRQPAPVPGVYSDTVVVTVSF